MNIETSPIASTVEAADAGSETKSTIFALLQLASLAGAAIAIFMPSIHIFSSKLEKALILGESTMADFRTLKESGGLDNDSNSEWLGYTVTHVQTEYDTGAKLSGYVLSVNKNDYRRKLASFENIKSSMSGVCGINWSLAPGGEMYHNKDPTITCSYLDEENGTIEIVVNKP